MKTNLEKKVFEFLKVWETCLTDKGVVRPDMIKDRVEALQFAFTAEAFEAAEQPALQSAKEGYLEEFEFCEWYPINKTTLVMKLYEGWLVKTVDRIQTGKRVSMHAFGEVLDTISTSMIYIPGSRRLERSFVEQYNKYMGFVIKVIIPDENKSEPTEHRVAAPLSWAPEYTPEEEIPETPIEHDDSDEDDEDFPF